MKASEKKPADNSRSRLIFLEELTHGTGGGKAQGLARLMKAAFTVPPGFVIVDAAKGPADGLNEAYDKLGRCSVAVRSSADNEDGVDLSWAGQYSTILNVRGLDELQSAVSACVESFQNARAENYRSEMMKDDNSSMSVVVQKMIEPSVAGVLFTADPVSGSRDTIVIEAVSGIGEALVDGSSTATRYSMDRKSDTITAETEENKDLLSHDHIRKMAEQAVSLEDEMGTALDYEWAIGKDSILYWLQVRPITTLGGPDIHEFDYNPHEKEYFTRANIGEMMPGAVTPLTMSTFADAVDFCIRHFYTSAGALTLKNRHDRFVCSFSGHLFLNLNMMFTMAGRVLGSTKESVELNLLGRPVDDLPEVVMAPWPVRFVNAFRFAKYVLMSGRYRKKLEKKAGVFDIPLDTDNAPALYRVIDREKWLIDWSYTWHLCVSTHSGVMNGILLEILKKAGCSPDELDSTLTALLTDITDLESADVIKRLEVMAAALREDADRGGWLQGLTLEDAVSWLSSDESGSHGQAFRELIEKHGHRGIREAELREKDWSEDPVGLIETLKSILAAPVVEKKTRAADPVAEIIKSYPEINRRAFDWALKQARKGVFQREHCKSLVIKNQSKFKHAYRRLAVLMVRDGLLPDEDCIFFLTHKEIGSVLKTGDTASGRTAVKRRRLLPEQQRLSFPDVFKGRPEPIDSLAADAEAVTVLRGTPVSSGIVRGPVKIIRTQDDASRMAQGDIMVASFTDIGWTPYYGLAGGLVTEIGCSLSHGAVVAREYGLPMVTAVSNAVGLLRDGQIIEIDGRKGTVVVIDSD